MKVINKMEFFIRRNFREKSASIVMGLILYLIPSQVWRVLMALFFMAALLPRDIENGRSQLLLSFPLKRSEVFLCDFVFGFSILTISTFLSMAFRGLFNGMDVIRCLGTAMFVYGLSTMFANAGKGNIAFPLLIIFIDLAFSFSRWKYVSPSLQLTPLALLVSIGIFVLAYFHYIKEGKIW